MIKDLFFTILCAILASCSQIDIDNVNIKSKQSANMNIKEVFMDIYDSKSRAAIAPVNSWTAARDKTIGVSIYQNNIAENLMRADTKNLKWTYIDGNWSTTTPTLIFASESGYVTAYYPWVNAANPTTLPIDNTKDWMYAPLTDNKAVTWDKPSTSLNMRHATSQLKVNIVRKGYGGTGHITNIQVKSAKMASAATLNTTTGVLSGHMLIGKFDNDINMTLLAGNPSIPTLALHESFVPVDDVASNVVFTCTVDGVELTASKSVKFEKGNIYSFTLNVTGALSGTPDIEDVITAESEAINLGLPSGLLWAAGNLGALTETDSGLYYMWGETEGHEKNSGYEFTSANYTAKGLNTISANLTLAQDAANVRLGGKWRMPTIAEFQELYNNTNVTWTTINGVAGKKFTSKTDASKYIFIPANGYCEGASLNDYGVIGVCWSSTFYNSSWSWYSYCISNYFHWDVAIRYAGYSVRAVIDSDYYIHTSGISYNNVDF